MKFGISTSRNATRAYARRLRNAVLGVTRALAFKALRGHMLTVTDYLDRAGAPTDWQHRWSSAFGGRVHRNYQKRYGHKAPQGFNLVRGIPRLVYVYDEADFDLLDEALEHYAAKTGLTLLRPCTQCERVWDTDELVLDANLDLICPDCVSTNEGVAEADAAAYRAYMYAGR